MRSLLPSGAGLAIAGALAAWSCGGGSTPTMPGGPAAPGQTTVTVNIVGSVGNSAYRPNPVQAKAGDMVIFRNDDSAMHHIVIDDGSADLGDIMPGATTRGLVLRNANATNYHCTIHPSMVGGINSASAPDMRPCPDPYGYGC